MFTTKHAKYSQIYQILAHLNTPYTKQKFAVKCKHHSVISTIYVLA